MQDITGKYSLKNIINLLLTEQFTLNSIITVNGIIKMNKYRLPGEKQYFTYSVKLILQRKNSDKLMEYNIENKIENNFFLADKLFNYIYFVRKINDNLLIHLSHFSKLYITRYNDTIILENIDNGRIIFEKI